MGAQPSARSCCGPPARNALPAAQSDGPPSATQAHSPEGSGVPARPDSGRHTVPASQAPPQVGYVVALHGTGGQTPSVAGLRTAKALPGSLVTCPSAPNCIE